MRVLSLLIASIASVSAFTLGGKLRASKTQLSMADGLKVDMAGKVVAKKYSICK
jgi:hypothetical protein